MSALRRLVCGGAAGITSVVCTYPLDIVRTRLSVQSASFAPLTGSVQRKLPGMWATMVTMYKTEGGFLALYRGIIPTVAGVAPYVSLRIKLSGEPVLIMPTGWPQFHDVRGRSEVRDARGRRESERLSKAACGRDVRRCCANLHISIVSVHFLSKGPDLLTDINTALQRCPTAAISDQYDVGTRI